MTSLFTRSGWLLLLLCISFGISIMYSHPIWWVSSSHFFSPIPAFSGLQQIPVWLDNVLFILFMTGIVYGVTVKRPPEWLRYAVVFLFAVLCMLNVGRLQPWSVFFIGCWIILLTNVRRQQQVLWIFVSAIYVWTGIFKLSPWYQKNVAAEIDFTVAQYFSNGFILRFLQFLSSTLPFVFIVFTLLAYISSLRKWIGLFFILYHIIVLIILSVWRNDPNYVIWSWNFSLALFWLYQFFQEPASGEKFSFRKHVLITGCVGWVFLYPLTWFTGVTSSNGCMHVYSGLHREGRIPFEEYNRPNASIWVDEKLFYSIDIDYSRSCGIPFPDAPANYVYVWKHVIKQKGTIILTEYHMNGLSATTLVSRSQNPAR